MTINYTTNLGLAEPVTGTESGTWGDDVNKGITDYLDIAIAGTQTISGSLTAVTLSITNGSSAGSNIAQAGTGSTGSAQYQIINCTGNPASLLTVTVPASSKTYIVNNTTSTSQSVKIVGAGPTAGVTIVSGEKATIAWNGSDFIKISSTVGLTTTVTVGTVTTGTWNGSLITGTYGGTGVNNGSNTITVAGNISFAGAFTQSFTASANTAVTLPAGNTASANNLLSSATAVAIVSGTPSSTTYLRGDGTWATIAASGGTVTSVSVTSANGFAGTVATATTTPAITLTTSITGLLQGNGTAISAVTIGSGLSFAGGTLSSTGGTTIGLARALLVNCIFP